MQFPLTLWDVSLWLAFAAIILLATAELISPYYGRTNLIIEKGKLRKTALIICVLFVITIIIRIYGIVLS